MKPTLYKILFIAIATFLFTGCAPTIKNITAQSITPELQETVQHKSSVSVWTFGGRDKDALGIQEVSDTNLKSAVTTAIKESKLFSDVMKDNANYNLEIFVVKVGQPVAGSIMKVNVELAWALKQENEIIWKKSIITKSQKTSDEEAMGINRLYVATQEATKKNIKEGLRLISQLTLK